MGFVSAIVFCLKVKWKKEDSEEEKKAEEEKKVHLSPMNPTLLFITRTKKDQATLHLCVNSGPWNELCTVFRRRLQDFCLGLSHARKSKTMEK